MTYHHKALPAVARHKPEPTNEERAKAERRVFWYSLADFILTALRWLSGQ